MARASTLRDTLVTASIATVVTTATALLLGKKEIGKPAAPLNATSHILWGDDAANHDDADWMHTAAGALLNASAMSSWAYMQHGVLPKPRTKAGAVLTGVAVSALAYVTDYYLVPKRFTPGFEKRLSPRALFVIYAALAGALTAGGVVSRDSA